MINTIDLNVKIDKIKLIIYDFDGVMTNNKVYVDQSGNETVQVNRADGLAIFKIKKLGISQTIISSELNPVVSVRASKLGIPCLQGINNKKDSVLKYCKENDIDIKKVAYVGNDINDKDAMEISGLTFCPSDGHKSIKEISDHILKAKGGNGVIRELLDLLTLQKGK
jgi:YrbI family 3-deoxy-D-manno-octulosonate 8-phosphate phosphatase